MDVQWQAAGSRALLAAALWLIISEGDARALPLGVPAVIAAVALSLALAPPSPYRPRLLPLLRFLGFFLLRSLVAGLDVARRILQPSLPVDPVFTSVPLRLPSGPPRWLLAMILSLVPGTLCVTLQGRDTLVLHRLTHAKDPAGEVRAAEDRVAPVFGLSLEERR